MDSILVELARLGISWETFWRIRSSVESLEQLKDPSFVNSLRLHPSTKRKLMEADWSHRSIEMLGNLGVGFVTCFSELYPERLFRLKAPPYVLFYRGNVEFLSGRSVAIVGSRKASVEGKELAYSLAKDFAQRGYVVVSGLALGIDAAAHRGALEVGRTVAVMGSSVEWVYPPENRGLYQNIVDEGLVISPFFPGTPPRRFNFPLRNRIIAAISERVVVVEAGEGSGALITARCAMEVGVPVAVCDLDAPGNRELLLLGAELLEEGKKEDDSVEDAILKVLDRSPLSVDEIAVMLNIDVASLQVRLLELELEGRVRRLPGGFYKKA